MAKKIQLTKGSIYEMKELSKQLQNHITKLSEKVEEMHEPINNELILTITEMDEKLKKIGLIIENAVVIPDFSEQLENIKKI